MFKLNVIFPEKEDREKNLNSLSGFDCSQPSYRCLALLTPRAFSAASLMARCVTPDVGHPISLLVIPRSAYAALSTGRF
jgi:hypothetical protein